MGWRLLLKMLILVLLVASVGACDTAAPPPAPTTTRVASDPTIPASDEGDATPADTAATEDIETTATPEIVDNPTPESEVAVQLPTIAVQRPLPPLPDGPLTIVALGDSLTEGDGDSPGEGGGYPARLQRSINGVRPGSQVINLGKSGWTSGQMVEGQLPTALQANPHIALVWIGSNNLFNNNGPGEEASDLSTFTGDIDATLRALTEADARVFIALMDDHSLRPYTSSPNGAGLSGEGLEYMSRLSQAFNDVIRAKAAEYGATTVDFYNTTIFSDASTL